MILKQMGHGQNLPELPITRKIKPSFLPTSLSAYLGLWLILGPAVFFPAPADYHAVPYAKNAVPSWLRTLFHLILTGAPSLSKPITSSNHFLKETFPK